MPKDLISVKDVEGEKKPRGVKVELVKISLV
jgi:hypothetical protein